MSRVATRMMAGSVGRSLPFVRFTTSGSGFSPLVDLVIGSTATLSWVCEETEQELSGTTPNFSWGSVGTRHVKLTVASGSLSDITTLNLGFSNGQDTGRYNIGAGYNRSSQGCTAVEHVNLLTGLQRFLAAQTPATTELPLSGPLDLTGMSALQYVECYGASISSLNLSGCTELIRLCMEANNLTELDLNPVAANLYDLRAAAQQGGSLTFTTLTSDLVHLYHFCVRDETVVGIPAASRFVALEEFWAWYTNQSGTLTVTSPVISSLLVYGNNYTAVDITGCDTLHAINLSHSTGLSSAAVDALLAEVDSWNTSTGYIDLTDTAAPTATGLAHASNLIGRSWDVDTSAVPNGGVNVDTFNRADCTGLAAVGNGWYAVGGDEANIASNMLVRTLTAGYRQTLNPGETNLPADYTVYTTFPHTSVGSFFGLTGRWNGSNGVRCMMALSSTAISFGDASGWNTNNVSYTLDAGFPSDWETPVSGTYRFEMRMIGTTIEAWVYTPSVTEGQKVAHATVTTNASATGTSYGVCGEGQNRSWDSIGVTL